MKRIVLIYFFGLLIWSIVNGQNVGIGVQNPTKARLEVAGVFGNGTTSGLFAGDRGISIQVGAPAIGFNHYRDDASPSSFGRYMANGFAAIMKYNHSEFNLSNAFEVIMYPNGNGGGLIPNAGLTAMQLSANGRLRLKTIGTGAVLEVGRGTGVNGTAVFFGKTYASHINFSTAEHTYIRSGVGGGSVFLEDLPGGTVAFGNGLCKVGINAPDPYYPLEIRQVSGQGLLMRNGREADLGYPFEWRVVQSGSSASLDLLYNGFKKASFAPGNGALTAVSDERLKTDIRPLETVMEKINRLQPVRYHFSNTPSASEKLVGFIAQEVEKVFPELVSRDSDSEDAKRMLNYNGFSVLAIKGTQEHETRMDVLDREMDQLQRRIDMLKNRKNK